MSVVLAMWGRARSVVMGKVIGQFRSRCFRMALRRLQLRATSVMLQNDVCPSRHKYLFPLSFARRNRTEYLWSDGQLMQLMMRRDRSPNCCCCWIWWVTSNDGWRVSFIKRLNASPYDFYVWRFVLTNVVAEILVETHKHVIYEGRSKSSRPDLVLIKIKLK